MTNYTLWCYKQLIKQHHIKKINDIEFRKNFILCVDGGVNENIVNKLNADHIVSGSCVLDSHNPKRKIMRLQTIGRYED